MERYNEAAAVRMIQRYLRQLSYEDNGIPPVPIDGIYESATRDAVVRFQGQNGIEQTGVVDRETFDMLYLAYLDSLRRFSPPSGFSPFPRVPEGYALMLGDIGFAVNAVQYLLGEVSAIIDAIEPMDISGIYGPETERAVAIFQAASSLPITGRVDKETWDILVETYNRHANDYSQ